MYKINFLNAVMGSSNLTDYLNNIKFKEQISRKLSIILSVFLVSSILFSCESNSKQNSIIYTSGGKTSEILLVIGNELYNSPIGDTINSVLTEVKPWFAQEEPYFDIFQIQPSAFMDIYQKYRNVLIVKIDKDYEENLIKAKADVYAKPQTVIEIKCKSKKEFLKLFGENYSQITDLFHQNELVRIGNAYNAIKVDSLTNILSKKFGFKMVFPKGFYLAGNKSDFAWLRRVTPDLEEGIFIYTQPYVDTNDFSIESIIQRRDILTKKYISGPLDSTWVKVSSVFPPYSETTTFKDNYATLVRSWWDIYGYPMGGPFLSYTFVDTEGSRLVTIEGYIKAPKKNKRDLLLHVEAIMNSFEKDSIN